MKSHVCIPAIVGLLWYLSILSVEVQSGLLTAAPQYVTIDAAYNFVEDDGSNVLHLISGDKVQFFRDLVPKYVYDRSDLLIPADMKVQAAFVTRKGPVRRIYYGDEYGLSVYRNSTYTKVRRLRYGPNRSFLGDGGPDAVVANSNSVYVFKGCAMSARKSWKKWEAQILSLPKRGLPCDIDAAWFFQSYMWVLKNDSVWFLQDGESASGPFYLNTYYELMDGWQLPPYVHGA